VNLLFVYNADSGLASALFDSAHKLLSPSTYSCNLCALTHGPAGPKREWAEFLKILPEPPEFLHRDEFLKRHPALASTPLPAIFTKRRQCLQLLADGPALSQIHTLAALIELVGE
jgi:hypothetical protein